MTTTAEMRRRPVVAITYSSREFAEFSDWATIFEAFVEAGATLVTMDCESEQATFTNLLAQVDALVLSGGGDVDPTLYGGDSTDHTVHAVSPTRDRLERLALEAAIAAGLPVLAICRGLQLMNAALGGSLVADLARDWNGTLPHRSPLDQSALSVHTVDVALGCEIAKWMGGSGAYPVNSVHHQGLDRLAQGLEPVAWSPDGLVEGVQDPARKLVGIQWHPELQWRSEPAAAALLAGFVTSLTKIDERVN